MRRYLTRRLLQLPALFLIVTLMTFGLMYLAPGGPEQVLLSGEDPNIRPEEIEALREKWGLNDPFYVQYGKWLYNLVVKFDLGRSFTTQRPAMESFMERLPMTFQLNVVTILLIYLLTIPLGVTSAVRQYSWIDYTSTTFGFLGYAMPSFWVGLMLILWVALPSGGLIKTNGYMTPDITLKTHYFLTVFFDRMRYMLLPTLTIVFSGMAALVRYTRNSMLDVLKEDYIRTARAKGLSEKVVIYKHAMRNALLPIITVSGGLIASFFGGSAIIEAIFAWPGVGQLALSAINKQDHPMVMGYLLFGFFVGTISSFITEFLYVWVDPRIKYS